MPTSDSSRPRGISLAIPWLIFVCAFVPYFWSLFIAVIELGDPPFTANDWLERLLLAGWLGLFLAAIVVARATNDRPTFHGIITFSFVLSVLGLFFVL